MEIQSPKPHKVFIVLQPSMDLQFKSKIIPPHIERTILGDFSKLQVGVAIDWDARQVAIKYQIRNLDINNSIPIIPSKNQNGLETCMYSLNQNNHPFDKFYLVGETERTVQEVQEFCEVWDQTDSLEFVTDFVTFLVTKYQIWKHHVRMIRSDGVVVPLLPNGFKTPLEYVKWKVLQVTDTVQKPMRPLEYQFNADILQDCLSISIEPNSVHVPVLEYPCEEKAVEQVAPCLNIVIMIVGSRGDVQPFIALAKGLIQYGHRIRVATHETFREFVTQNGLEFYPLAGDPAELMAFMVKNPGLIPKLETIKDGEIEKKREMMEQILTSTFEACVAPDENQQPFEAQAIISNPPTFGHIHCAEKLSIPLHSIVHLCSFLYDAVVTHR
jgi:hypothetical protein